MNDSEKLIKLRQALGMSQRELAKEFGVTAGAIAHWENETRKIPGPILKLIEIYNKALRAQSKNVVSNKE